MKKSICVIKILLLIFYVSLSHIKYMIHITDKFMYNLFIEKNSFSKMGKEIKDCDAIIYNSNGMIIEFLLDLLIFKSAMFSNIVYNS